MLSRWTRVRARTLISISFVIVIVVLLQLVNPKQVGGVSVDKLNDPQKRAIEVTLEMNKLVISLATLVFGAIGTLAFTADGGPKVEDAIEKAFVIATLSFSAAAIYFSYLVYDKLVEMLSNSFLDLNGDLLAIPRRLQVNCLTLAVLCLGVLVIHILMPSGGHRHAAR
jgi:hypothetical protein